jgi:hypothetical protein
MENNVDKRLEKIEGKIDIIVEKIHSIDKTLDRNTDSLDMHIKRTNLLEKKLAPIDKHVTMVNGVIKFLLGLAALTALFKLFY